MTKDIENLIALQKIDSQLFKIKKFLELKPREIKALEEEFSNMSSGLKKLEDDLRHFQVEQKTKELDLQSKEETVSKQKTQLFQVKSNKEYNALQLEIEKIKADNSVLEEQIIVAFEKIDFLKQAIAHEKEKLAAEEKKLNETKRNIELEVRKLKEELDVLNMQRKQIIESGIKPAVLSLYERILENRGELALVAIKNDACCGCFMGVRPQVINELCLGKLVTCENCSRILYIENEE
ncbi:MAG: hypothetical protein KJ893_11265 [Candidatus Omnitrophica bacterium]|nr:hypothetical protein [Candidatus Omnitrophota bacterium]MBU4478541.1 hypothetical protein [Candidatus Omnitrophota bacterium]MCG2702862.1 C4-type zinc ribbon domain-containing protein [Candidatus Omnitrophota bacterium]